MIVENQSVRSTATGHVDKTWFWIKVTSLMYTDVAVLEI